MNSKTIQYDYKVNAIHTLRVNLKSLVMERKIILAEEQRAGLFYRYNLYKHRIFVLRPAARIAGLALAYVRGRRYRQCESKLKNASPVDAVALFKKLRTHGIPVTQTEVNQWLSETE